MPEFDWSICSKHDRLDAVLQLLVFLVMPATGNYTKRKAAALPLHIDTTSFTNPPPTSALYPWRRIANKRQLPALVLAILLIFSVSINFVEHARHHKASFSTARSSPRDDLLSFSYTLPPTLSNVRHAIIVAGHAIFTKDPKDSDLLADENWILEPYQQGGGHVSTFLKHIRKGLDLLSNDTEALLIFSGGQTRGPAGPRSEGESYWLIAESMLRNDANSSTPSSSEEDDDYYLSLRDRLVVEEYARDSHENLLFSLCRFYEMTGQYPSSVTVIGFEFKRKRFQDIHRASIRYPAENFTYIGIDPPFDPVQVSQRIASEATNSLGPFQQDLYGCHGSLRQKKVLRNPFHRRHGYQLSCPALADLLVYCPSENLVFPGPLPWSD